MREIGEPTVTTTMSGVHAVVSMGQDGAIVKSAYLSRKLLSAGVSIYIITKARVCAYHAKHAKSYPPSLQNGETCHILKIKRLIDIPKSVTA